MYQTKNHQSLRASLLVGVASATVMAFAGTAVAQEAAEVVVVTGSRLPSANLTTVSPVTSITAEEVSNSGVTRIEDLVNQLPQAFATQNAAFSNGASGEANLDLRGLGSVRTLVLIDGRRMPYGGPDSSAADVNEIPGIMVERIEVLTGGASAVYGSDAIAGVVNFIMRKDFEGVQVDFAYDTFWHNNNYNGPGDLREIIALRHATNPAQFNLPNDSYTDGDGHEESILMGVNSANGKGNITAYFTHRKNKPILQANRDFSSCALGAPGDPDLDGDQDWTCGGSSTSYPGRFLNLVNFGSTTIDASAVGPNGHHNQFRPFSSSLDQYNFGPLNYYQRPDERYSFGALGHYEVASYADIYGSLMFTDYRSRSQIAPSGQFFSLATVNCDNPLLSANEASTLGCAPASTADTQFYLGRRNVEGGGRIEDIHYSSYRINGGVRGPISSHWSYDLNGQVAKVLSVRTYLNDFSKTRTARALEVITGPALLPDGTPNPLVGQSECKARYDNTDPLCVPWDIWQIGGVSRQALDYLQIPLLRNGTTEQYMLNLSFTGDVPAIQSPWAKNDMALAFGAEYRYDKVDSVVDVAYQTFDGAGQGGPIFGITGATDVVEVFAELKLPIVEDAPMFKELSFEGAYRNSHYNTGVETDTYKIAGNWSPTEDFRLRASYQRAVRAPNVLELFTTQGFNLFDLNNDPCDATAGAIPGSCIGTNPWQVTSAQSTGGLLSSPAGQYNFLSGGNPNLAPEISDTYSYGVVLTPTFLSGFTASVDWFDIKIVDLITTLNPGSILTACYSGNLLSQCQRITRSGIGLLWAGNGHVESLATNIGGLRTKGLDFNVYYRTEIADGWGAFSLNLVATWLDELTVDEGLGLPTSVYNCAGFFGAQCGTPNPEWRHRLRVAWEIPMEEWSPVISVSWRRFSAVTLFGNNTLFTEFHAPLGSKFPAQNYIDLGFTAEIATGTSFRFGINNLFDKDPPITDVVGTGAGNGNTFPGVYDSFGRYVFAGVTVNL